VSELLLIHFLHQPSDSGIVLLSMADGSTKAREAAPLPPGLDQTLATDGAKLTWVRSTPQVSLQAVLNMAHRIHDVALRDAALGHIIKTRMRYISGARVLMNHLELEKSTLYEIADMMSAARKRASMFARIDAFEKPRKGD
jgi:hypothetical protein